MTDTIILNGKSYNAKSFTSREPGWWIGTGNSGYSDSPTVYRCCTLRANALASIPWRLTQDGEEVDGSELERMLKEMPEGGFRSALKAIETDMLLSGAGYVLKNRSGSTLNGLQRVHPSMVQVQVTPAGIDHFDVTVNSAVLRVAREDMVYFREINPTLDLVAGVAPVRVCKKWIDIEVNCGQYLASFFENSALPGLLMTTEQAVPEPEMRRIKKWWDRVFKGVRKSHQAGFADRGLKAQILSFEPDKLALETIAGQARLAIGAAFGVPEVLLDMSGATFANADEARQSLYEDTIVPRAGYFADVLTSELAVEFGLVLEFETESIPVMQEDDNAKAIRLALLVDKGAIRADVMATEMGFSEEDFPAEEEPEEDLADDEAEPVPDALQEYNDQQEAIQDLHNWQRKSIKALKKRGKAQVEFDSEHISGALFEAIDEQLATCKTAEEVIGVFSAIN